MASKKISDKLKSKRRLALVYFILASLFIGLMSRLFYVMVIMEHNSKKLKEVAASQSKSDIIVGAKRGNILDRNGNALAASADVYRVDLDLLALNQTLKTKKISNKQFSDNLASILNMNPEDIEKALNRTLENGLPASWAPVKRRVEKLEADKVKALKLFGILVSSDSKRYYPNHNFLSHVMGHINEEGNGITGIELAYNEILTGVPGRLIYKKDSRSNELFYEDSRYTQPVNGKNIMLTIDEVIQGYAENAAQKALIDNKAKGVSIMIMNPKNGEILAMTSKPDYDLTNPQAGGKDSDELFSLWKNPSIENSFEPGSIFKIITAAAAMEYGTSKEQDKFVCTGSLKVANRTIYCANKEGHGVQSFIDILKNSCNVGFMQVGKKLGKENLFNFASKMGFGKKTGIDLPGEQSGIIKLPKDVSEVDLATESFGQSVSVTQVQFMAAFNAIANGGTWIKPHLMKNIINYNDAGNIVVEKSFDKYDKRQVFDKKLSNTLKGYLEKVVSEGAASNAYIEEYHIGGKTGTAQKVENGVYKDQTYMSSFVGLAPYDDPKVTMIVTIDEPDSSNYYAGQIAAPVVKDLYNKIFNYLAINPRAIAE